MTRSTTPTLLAQLLITFVAYAATGFAALALAIPPSYASPLYPSAGIGLAFLLAWGNRMAVGVGLGAFAINFWLSYDRSAAGSSVWLLPTVIAAGAALQAWVGAALARRHVAWPLRLEAPADIARFLLLVGPLACLVSSSIAVTALWWSGTLGVEHLALTWGTWWGGDTLGVLIGAPILLTLIGRPREDWAPRRTTVGLPLAAVTALLAMAILQVSRWDSQRLEANFQRDAGNITNTVTLRMQSHLDALDAAHGLYFASEDVTREEFARFAQPWLAKLPSMQAIGFHQHVLREDLPAFEARVRAEGRASYRVFDRPNSTPPTGSEVFAMRYIEPARGNIDALGVNVLSIPAARVAIEATRRLDRSVATAAFRLTQDASTDQAGVVVYRAIYRGSPTTPQQREAAAIGLVFVTLRMDDALRSLMQGAPAYLNVCLLDDDPAAPRRRLAGPPDCERATPGSEALRKEARLPFAERQWTLRVTADPGAATDPGVWNAWLFSIVGLFATSMLGALLLTMTGHTRRVEGAVRDRTARLESEMRERQVTEAALRESEQRFRSIFNSVPIGVVYTDLQGRVRQPNAAYCRLTGYSHEELVQMAVPQFTHPDDHVADTEFFGRLVRGEIPMYKRHKRYVTKDGRTVWVNVSVALLRDAEGTPHRTVGVVEDITEHLRLREAEQAREAAEASNRAKSDFLSRMSHELRTPLNAMLGFAQLMNMDERTPLSQRQQQWVSQIQRAGWHLLEMINDVLDLSRIEAGTVKLLIEPLDVAEIVRASVALVEAEAAKRGLRIEVAPASPPGALLAVNGDATRVKQILTNLLSNAVKYNREGGGLRLACRAVSDGSVEVEVSDTGLGMSEAQLADLFQPFNRLGRERSGQEGTGIGLVISKRLAELMGGTLRARSVEGEGSTFVLTLPRALDPDTLPSGLDEIASTGDPGYHRRRVCYIEDNETNAEVMRGILQQRPQVELEISPTGLDGLARVKQRRPDLVLLDMHLPDIDGLELLRHLQSDPQTASVPVVVVSADALAGQIEEALKAGARRYLTKPVSVNELLTVVDEVLEQQDTMFG
ncbi:CHASE domain-containing protein [Methylibium rhizosphaerae]|uniref:CHASE domain-containing protein n=1 Tax=Methylibium rhizosphaerae TaxID=2570323 RepID=UPI00112E63B3|nr:CHASE domain-containing protein [Methylibium rhizosphaerae]